MKPDCFNKHKWQHECTEVTLITANRGHQKQPNVCQRSSLIADDVSKVIDNNRSPPKSGWKWTAGASRGPNRARGSFSPETWGSFAAHLWQKRTGGRSCWNGWAPLSPLWRPSLESCGTSWTAAWSTDSGATARWSGGGSWSSCSWQHTTRNSAVKGKVAGTGSGATNVLRSALTLTRSLSSSVCRCQTDNPPAPWKAPHRWRYHRTPSGHLWTTAITTSVSVPFTRFKSPSPSLTYFQSGQRVVNDADQHPPGFYRVDRSIQKESTPLLLSWFDQHVAPVEVPADTRRTGWSRCYTAPGHLKKARSSFWQHQNTFESKWLRDRQRDRQGRGTGR